MQCISAAAVQVGAARRPTGRTQRNSEVIRKDEVDIAVVHAEERRRRKNTRMTVTDRRRFADESRWFRRRTPTLFSAEGRSFRHVVSAVSGQSLSRWAPEA